MKHFLLKVSRYHHHPQHCYMVALVVSFYFLATTVVPNTVLGTFINSCFYHSENENTKFLRNGNSGIIMYSI